MNTTELAEVHGRPWEDVDVNVPPLKSLLRSNGF